ncbi:MAG: hypothetical protein AAF617_15910, partial [Bacteroidota bacterium]
MKSHDIKNILEERRIEVSAQSWEQLAGQLDANDRKQRRKFFYIPYAACLALLVGWLVFMIATSEKTADNTNMVNQENTILPIIKENERKRNSTPKTLQDPQEVIKETRIAVQESSTKNTKLEATTPKSVSETKEVFAAELQKEVRTAVTMQEKQVPQKIQTVITEKEVVVDANTDLKASIIALLKDEKMTVTNAEIDQLLKDAQETIKEFDVKENINYTNFATADELLNEVEYELDMSFKQRVYEIVKRNIQKT